MARTMVEEVQVAENSDDARTADQFGPQFSVKGETADFGVDGCWSLPSYDECDKVYNYVGSHGDIELL